MGKWKTLRDRVNTILTGLTGAGQPLYAVYNAHNYVPAGFPYATIGPSDLPSDIETNAENLRTYGVDIYVWHNVESVNIGEASALDTVMDAVDLIIDALDADYNMNGSAEAGCKATTAMIKTFDSPNGAMIGAKITVKCQTLHQFK
jgi:hypothetical protein